MFNMMLIIGWAVVHNNKLVDYSTFHSNLTHQDRVGRFPGASLQPVCGPVPATNIG